MFWNDPNLYNLTLKDVPPVHSPLFGQAPFLGTVPPRVFPTFPNFPTFPIQQAYLPYSYPTYPVMPYAFNPYLQPPVNPMFQPFNMTYPFPNPYRPFPF